MHKTVVDILQRRVDCTPDRSAFFVITNGQWQPISWATFSKRVERLAAALMMLGVVRGDRVGICALTSLEWEITQMAVLRIGASVVGLDIHYTDDLLTNLIAELRIVVFVAQNSEILKRIPEPVAQSFKLVLTAEKSRTESSGPRTLNDLQSIDMADYRPPVSPRPEDEAFVVFSSGTTGAPKPVPYRHDQVSLALHSILEAFADIEEGSTLVCWLPLANLFQRMINFGAMARGATSYIVEDPRAVMNYLRVANPHVFIGVPRFFEQVYAGITRRIEASPGFSANFAKWGLNIAQRRAKALRCDRSATWWVRILWPVADRLVLRRIRATFGANLRYFISGSAPMPYWLLEWFDAIGLPVLEAYGISDNIVPIASNRYDVRKLGTVGKPLPVHVVKLAEDGEILVRGAGVALQDNGPNGAENTPLRQNGFLATGDLGEFDAAGFLRIIGRKADVFKTSGGKWVAPAEIEGRLRQIFYVEHAVALGAGKKAVVALIGVTAIHLNELGAGQDSSSNNVFQVQLSGDVANALIDLPAYQQPAGLLVVSADAFSVASGGLTTNLKIRRRCMETKFAAAIDRLYMAIDEVPSLRSEKLPLVTIDMAVRSS